MKSSLSGFLKCVSGLASISLSNAEKVISSVEFLITVKTQFQILTLKTCDQRTECNNKFAFWNLVSCTKVEDKIWGRP